MPISPPIFTVSQASNSANFSGNTHIREGLISELPSGRLLIVSQWILKPGVAYIFNENDRASEPVEFKVETDLTFDFPPPLLSNNKIWTYVDLNSQINYTTEPPQSWNLSDRLYLNTIESEDGSSISSVTPLILEGDTYTKNLLDRGGSSNINLALKPASSLSIATDGGNILIAGSNFINDSANPHRVQIAPVAQIIWDEYDPSGGLIATGVTDLDFGRYWDGVAVATFGGNDASAKFFYIDSNNSFTCIIGSNRYSSLNVCSQRWLSFESVPQFPDRALFAVLLGRADASDVTNTNQIIFIKDKNYPVSSGIAQGYVIRNVSNIASVNPNDYAIAITNDSPPLFYISDGLTWTLNNN